MRIVSILLALLLLVSCQFFSKNSVTEENTVRDAFAEEDTIIINEPPQNSISGFGCVQKTAVYHDPSMFGQTQTYFSGVLFSYLNIYECQQEGDGETPAYTERTTENSYGYAEEGVEVSGIQ
jgi:hypothetical protein